MLRISDLESSREAVTLRLEGQLIGPWVEELRRSCDRVLTGGGSLTLDLSEVAFIDRKGLALLQALQGRQVALINCSPFVAQQIKGGTAC